MSTQTFPSTGAKQAEMDPSLFEEEMDDSLFEDETTDSDKSNEPQANLFELAKKRRDVKERIKLYVHGSGDPSRKDKEDTNKYKQALSDIDKEIKAAGFDPDLIEKDFADLPNIKGFTDKDAIKLKEENPLLFDRKLAAIKSQYALFNAIKTKEGKESADKFFQTFIAGQAPKNYEEQRENTKVAIDAVYKYIDDESEQRKVLGDLVRDKMYNYGVGIAGQEEALKADPRYASLNPYQVMALQFMEDVDPARALSYNRLLSFTPEDLEKEKGNSSFMRGYQSKARDLENIGMNIQRKALEEKMTSMLKTRDSWNDEQKREYLKTYEAYDMLSKDMEGQNQRYPAMAVIDADIAMQEAMGSSTKGVAEQTILGIGENVDDAVNWLGDLVKSGFIDEKSETKDDLTLLGDKTRSRLSQYETLNEQLFPDKLKYTFTGKLGKEIEKIKADNSLTNEEKRAQIREKILANQGKNVELVANDAAGKMNLTGKTFLNTVSNIVSEIAPQLAFAYLTSGASASQVKQLSSLFSSTFAIAYRDNYNSAIEEGAARPSEKAFTNTLIEALSELMHNDLSAAKKMLGGKPFQKALGSVTREEMSALGRAAKGRWAKFAQALGQSARASATSAYKEAAEEFAGRIGTNVADKTLFNAEVDLGEGAMKDFVTTFIGMLPLGLLGLSGQYKQVNRVQQYAVYEAGMDPAKYNAKVDEDLGAGVISEGEAMKRKKVIAAAAAAVQGMNPVRPDGTEMTDNEKAKYVTNQLALNDIKQQLTTANEQQKTELETQQELIENEQKKILTPEPQKTDRETIEAARQEELAAADVEYENYDKEFIEEQKDIINEKYDEQIKELEKQEAEKQKLAKQAEETPAPEFSAETAQVAPEIFVPGKIESEKDVEAELSRAMEHFSSRPVQSAEALSIPQQEGEQAKDLANPATNVSADQLGITPNSNINEVVDKLIEQKAGLTPVLDYIRNQPIMKRLKFEYYEPGKNKLLDKWMGSQGWTAESFAGLYLPKSRLLGTDYEALADTVVINPKTSTNPYYDITHELGHAVTLENIGAWKKILSSADQELINDIYRYIKSKKSNFSDANLDEYGMKSVEEFLVESIINPDFRKKVADVWAKSRKEFLEEARKGQPRDFIKVLIEFVRDLLRYAMGKGAYAENIETRPLIDQAVDLMTKVFFGKRTDVVAQRQYGNKSIPLTQQRGNQGLAMAARRPQTQEDAVREIIRETPKTVSDARLLEIIKKATGLPDATIAQWIKEERDLPPTQRPKDAAALPRKTALNKFERLFRTEFAKPEPWHKRAWSSLKNASSQWDNPYRFVTKIVEDINKHYNLTNKEVIPLGRAFEKSAAGRAALRVDEFVQTVVFGRIGAEKLGRIKGEQYKDFQKYMAARRVIDRFETQERKRANREDVSRQTGNITVGDANEFIASLNEKYKEDVIKSFEKRAKAFQQQMDQMLQTLVASGILSKEQFDKIKADNDFYAPFSVVRSQLRAAQTGGPVGISGVVKRIKGIGYDLQSASSISPVALLNDLAKALGENKISPEQYFDDALTLLENALQTGAIDQQEFDDRISQLENPGFQLNDMMDAAAQMVYRAEGMALKNRMMQRMYSFREQDTEGLFIQEVDGMMPMTLPGGDVAMVVRPLNTIPVSEGFAPVRLKVNGKDKVVAINKYAANKLNTISNPEMPWWMKSSDAVNKIFRAAVITLSPGFQAVNFIIDFVRASMLSRYGLLTGKGLVAPIANLLLYFPQYIEAVMHSVFGNIGIKTETYKQWMESDSFSKGMFDNLFNNNKQIKSINSSTAKKILDAFLKLKFVEIPGSILEQSHKIAAYQRGMAVEGFKPEMATAMLASLFNQHVKPNMSQQDLSDAMDKLNYEVQNYAGSPNFPQTAPWLKVASIFLQFFSARVKGEMTDYRRVANMITGKGEGVKLSKQETAQIAAQFASVSMAIAYYAIANNADDEDEKHFDSVSPYHQDNYLNIPAGMFEYEDDKGNVTMQRDYVKMPLRGLTASLNVIANKYMKYAKHKNPKSLEAMLNGVIANASPLNLHGDNKREYGESAVSNLTPVFKYFLEYSFNRDTHSHRDIIPDSYGPRSLLSRYNAGAIKPWKVTTSKTPDWCIDFSIFLYEKLGFIVSPITIDHMEKTMGNPTEIYDKAVKKRLIRSEANYPVAGSTPAGKKKEKYDYSEIDKREAERQSAKEEEQQENE